MAITKNTWKTIGLWAAIGVPVALVILAASLAKAEPHMPRTVAKPLTSTEVSFTESSRAYTAADGIVVVKADPTEAVAEPVMEPVSVESTEVQTEKFTQYTMPEAAALSDGSIGVLTVPKIGLSVGVFESDSQMEDMDKGAAHFKHTSSWDGNIGLSAHNVNFDGTDGYFKNLYRLSVGDEMVYTTQLGERTYAVTEVVEIAETDWSRLKRTTDDRLTLVTCISGKPDKRLLVQGVAK